MWCVLDTLPKSGTSRYGLRVFGASNLCSPNLKPLRNYKLAIKAMENSQGRESDYSEAEITAILVG